MLGAPLHEVTVGRGDVVTGRRSDSATDLQQNLDAVGGIRLVDTSEDVHSTTSGVVAEADGNRTRQRSDRPLTGFEDRGTHQASRRLRISEVRWGHSVATPSSSRAESVVSDLYQPDLGFWVK